MRNITEELKLLFEAGVMLGNFRFAFGRLADAKNKESEIHTAKVFLKEDFPEKKYKSYVNILNKFSLIQEKLDLMTDYAKLRKYAGFDTNI